MVFVNSFYLPLRVGPRGQPLQKTKYYEAFGPLNGSLSTAEVIRAEEDIFGYRVCHFTDVCVNATHVIFTVNSSSVADVAQDDFFRCCQTGPDGQLQAKKCPSFPEALCECFTAKMKPAFAVMPAAAPRVEGEVWITNQWAFHHQPSHFAMKMVLFQSIMQHQAYYNLPPFNALAWQDAPSPLTSFEGTLLEVVRSTLPFQIEKLLFSSDVLKNEHKQTCFRSVYLSSLLQIWARDPRDLFSFQLAAHALLGLENGAPKGGCPPRRAAVLYRSEGNGLRKMVNMDDVVALLRSFNVTEVDRITVTAAMTGSEQARIFSSYGLLLTSHSSQLANILYCHRNAVIIEISPILTRGVWQRGNTQKFINSLGHRPIDPRVAGSFHLCAMSNREKRLCPNVSKSAFRDSDYEVNLHILSEDLSLAFAHLNTACGSAWLS